MEVEIPKQKVYRDEEYGFEITYPDRSEWVVEQTVDERRVGRFRISPQQKDWENQYCISIRGETTDLPKNTSIYKFLGLDIELFDQGNRVKEDLLRFMNASKYQEREIENSKQYAEILSGYIDPSEDGFNDTDERVHLIYAIAEHNAISVGYQRNSSCPYANEIAESLTFFSMK